MIGKRRAYALMTGLILFNLAIPVAVAMGFDQMVSGGGNVAVGSADASKGITDLYLNGIGDKSFWFGVAGVTAFLIAASKLGGIHVTLSSIVYLGVFVGTAPPLKTLLTNMSSNGWIPPELIAFMVGVYAIAFLVGLMELSR